MQVDLYVYLGHVNYIICFTSAGAGRKPEINDKNNTENN